MDLLSRAHIIKYHKDNIRQFGVDSQEAVGWKSKGNQSLRFKVLSEIGDLNRRSLLDVGCGPGDLHQFLKEQHINCNYFGIDQVKEFIEAANEKYKGDESTSFLYGDFWTGDVGHFDYVLASGALSYRNADLNFIYKMIFRLYSLSNIGFAFNLLQSVEQEGGGLVAYDKKKIVAYCTKICPHVILKDDYMKGDYSIFLCK